MASSLFQPDFQDIPNRVYMDNDTMLFKISESMYATNTFICDFIKRAEAYTEKERKQYTEWRISDILLAISLITIVMLVPFMFHYIDKTIHNEVGFCNGMKKYHEFLVDNMIELAKNKYVASLECEMFRNSRGRYGHRYFFRFELIENNNNNDNIANESNNIILAKP